MSKLDFVYDDGGRQEAGYKGKTGDCAARAIAIATPMPYQDAYDLVNDYGKKERRSKGRATKSSARTGTYKATFKRIMRDLGFNWTPTMQVGQGCRVHMRADELPQSGTIILNVSKHYCVVIDGVVHDTYMEDRNGTRCVYGYWHK